MKGQKQFHKDTHVHPYYEDFDSIMEFRVNLINNLEFLREEDIESDFKIVADYFAKRKRVPDYCGAKDVINHVDEFFKLMKVLTNDNKFGTMYNESVSTGKGGLSMDDFLDTVEARGEAKGEAKIIQEFIKNGNMSVEQIADILKLPVEYVRKLAEMVLVSA